MWIRKTERSCFLLLCFYLFSKTNDHSSNFSFPKLKFSFTFKDIFSVIVEVSFRIDAGNILKFATQLKIPLLNCLILVAHQFTLHHKFANQNREIKIFAERFGLILGFD